MRKQTTPLSESQIQHDCMTWFAMQYPKIEKMIFAVPNGGKRTPKDGARMKYEGVKRGVADIILLIPKKGFASLCIEMKTPKGKQQDEQKEWQREAEKYHNKYVVCHSLAEFMKEVNTYLL